MQLNSFCRVLRRIASPLGLPLLAFSSLAHAERLAIFTADRLSVRDSGSLTTELDFATYTLPNGFVMVSADRDPDDGRFYLLGRNAGAGLCGVALIDLANRDSNKVAPIVPVGGTVACSATVGDLEFINSPSGFDAGWGFADGSQLLSYDPELDDYSSFTFSSSSGGTPDILAVGLFGEQSSLARVIQRESGGAISLRDITDVTDDTITLGAPRTISGATLNGALSLDISERTIRGYLLSSGNLYELVNNGTATNVGALPAGTVAVVAASANEASGVVSDERTIRDASTGTNLTIATDVGRFTASSGAARPVGAQSGNLGSSATPYGFASFSITLPSGATSRNAQVTLIPNISGATPDRYIKCIGPNSCAFFDASRVTFSGRNTTVTLTDGSTGDADGVVNGVISDPGAPAVFTAAPTPTPTPTPNPSVGLRTDTGGGGAMSLTLLLPTLLTVFGLRRRKRRLSEGQ